MKDEPDETTGGDAGAGSRTGAEEGEEAGSEVRCVDTRSIWVPISDTLECGPRNTARMKVFIFLVLGLAVSSADTDELEIIDVEEVGQPKDITEINRAFNLRDDIVEAPNVQRSSINYDDYLWESPVPYILGNDLEINAKGVILRALDEYRLKSCIDFRPRNEEYYYINVKKLNGCYSYVGRIFSGQEISIGRYCDSISIVQHEFLHALAFFHEQSRYDRDDHVKIQFENIEEGYENNFEKVNKTDSTVSGLPYDYDSVMHYGSGAFSNGNGSTIITKDPKFQNVIGQRLQMSPIDVKELNRRYKCNLSKLRLNGWALPEPQRSSNLSPVTLMQTDDKGGCLNQKMGNSTALIPSYTSSSAVSPSTGTMIPMVIASLALMAGTFRLTP